METATSGGSLAGIVSYKQRLGILDSSPVRECVSNGDCAQAAFHSPNLRIFLTPASAAWGAELSTASADRRLLFRCRRQGSAARPAEIHDDEPNTEAGRPATKGGEDFYGIPNPSYGTKLKLTDLRDRLIRQEETIIFALIERAQFRLNSAIYIPGEIPIPGRENLSFSEYLLYELEKVYSKVRRYTSPDEHPFSPDVELPGPVLAELEYPPTIREKSKLNFNAEISALYKDKILPHVCAAGDDQNYGSSATCDVACLQALSKRIHYGKFIAEAKFQEDPELYRQMAEKRQIDSIMEALTNSKVEELLLKRVENKASAYGQEIDYQGGRPKYKVEPALIARIYKEYIIPLTKKIEVDYLLARPFLQ